MLKRAFFSFAPLQVWVPAIEDKSELQAILEARLGGEAEQRAAVAGRLVEFWDFFRSQAGPAVRAGLSVRDLLAWVGAKP